MLFLWFACITQHRGIVTHEKGRVMATASEGDAYRLYSSDKTISALGGCILQLEGLGGIRWFYVKDYEILDAGDGSAPFIGKLEQRGIQYFLSDETSGSLFRLQEDQDLSLHLGKRILVVGYVVGPHDLKVLSLRVLEE